MNYKINSKDFSNEISLKNYIVLNHLEDVKKMTKKDLERIEDETVRKITTEIHNLLNKRNKKQPFLERPINPPSDSYEDVGFSKLDIKPTGRGYVFLFE